MYGSGGRRIVRFDGWSMCSPRRKGRVDSLGINRDQRGADREHLSPLRGRGPTEG